MACVRRAKKRFAGVARHHKGVIGKVSDRELATLTEWRRRDDRTQFGLIGTSYQTINQWMVAARQPEGLAAILPWDGAFDYYRELAFYGGILNPAWKFWWDHQVVPDQNGNGSRPSKMWSMASGQRMKPVGGTVEAKDAQQ